MIEDFEPKKGKVAVLNERSHKITLITSRYYLNLGHWSNILLYLDTIYLQLFATDKQILGA